MSNNEFSDEQLQAFVDDEIDVSDRTEIMEAMAEDENLSCRVCELLQIKDSVKLAYREPPQPAHVTNRWEAAHKKTISLKAIAATLIFTIGALAGWIMNSQPTAIPGGSPSEMAQLAPANQELKRVVLHISTADPGRLEQALDDAELLLSGYKDNPEMVQMEVVANTEGLALLRSDTSPYVDRIRRMAHEYDNLNFLACSRTIEKLRLKGIDVHLVPEAMVIPGALEKIVDRLQDGWVYIRV